MVVLFWIALFVLIIVIFMISWKIQNPKNQDDGLSHEYLDFEHHNNLNAQTLKNGFKSQTKNHPVVYAFDIVGEGAYQLNLSIIAGPKEKISKFYECSAKISSEPYNKFDKNAVKVEINGFLVGYLSRNDAQKLAGKSINKTVDAVINGGWSDDIDEGQYGVKLAIKNVSDLI